MQDTVPGPGLAENTRDVTVDIMSLPVFDDEVRLLKEDIELNSAQVAKLHDIRQSAIRRMILFGLLICSAGWVLWQAYALSREYLERQLNSGYVQSIFQHIEAMSSLLGFLALLSICFGLLALGFATAFGHFFGAQGLIRAQEAAIADANEALRESVEAISDE